MTSTATRRQPALVCCAAAVGLAVTALLAVRVPPPSPVPARPQPTGAAGPAVAVDPARPPSGTTRTGLRQVLNVVDAADGRLR
ncbi:hypothetical protein ACWCXH_32260 [Kitasatospora sp. NPDC001660]